MYSFSSSKQKKIDELKKIQQMYIKNKKLAQIVIANNIKSKRINQLVQKHKFAKYNFDDDASIFNDNASVYDDNLSVIGDNSYLFDDVSSMYDEDFSDPLYAPPKNSEKESIKLNFEEKLQEEEFSDPLYAPQKESIKLTIEEEPVKEEEQVKKEEPVKEEEPVIHVKLEPIPIEKLNGFRLYFYRRFNHI